MNLTPPGPIGAAERETFQRDGVVCLRGLLDRDWIAWLRDSATEVMARPGPHARDLAAEGSTRGSFFTDIYVWKHNPNFLHFIRESPIAEAAAQLMASREIRLYNDHLLVKEPGTETPTHWHQDLPYFRIDGMQACSVWIGLDPVTKASGAMSFVKGSHLWNRLYRPVGLGTGQPYGADEFDGAMPDIDADPAAYPAVCYEMKPGDVTVHHVRTVHGAQGNATADTRRRGYSVRLAGDDVTWLKRKFSPSGVEVDLPDGAPLRGDLFPLLWPRHERTAA
jgi:ectoine hydroxylase-related dioxygenase (phytanoyl-CoA dioxygenase family)